MKEHKWLSEVTLCDICGKKFGKYFYDAKTSNGQWGLICEECFDIHGVGTGIGYGQKYETETKEGIGGFEERE